MFIVTNTFMNDGDSCFIALEFQSEICFFLAAAMVCTVFLDCDFYISFLCPSIQCNLQYTANETIGLYAVALQIEDFASTTDTVPLSSIPLQFIIEVYSSTAPCVSNQPEIIGGTRCVEILSSYQERIVAQSGGCNIRFVLF